ncbi:unnamed protein product [Microthlaspi erraticum]|uniref:Uncharacterized protein n=1 Tax=Microthlaspi erraticum TaxID=1685480 RepID=A0A6D2LL46_9BRAS|nr:unnamed protein product [Microthlaspi erraticum]
MSSYPRSSTQQFSLPLPPVLQVISATYDKQGRYGLKRLVDNMHMSFPCNSNAAHADHEQLREEVKTLKKIQIEKDNQIKFLLKCNKLFLDKLGICPPSPLSSPMEEDESETQE